VFLTATNEQLERVEAILQQLDHFPGPETATNRRRSSRVNIHAAMSATIISESGEGKLQLFSRNISTSGIGFVSRRPCKSGERLAILFELPAKPPKLVLAKITFCRYVRAGLYDAGAEFLDCVSAVANRIPPHWHALAPLNTRMMEPEPTAPSPRARAAK